MGKPRSQQHVENHSGLFTESEKSPGARQECFHELLSEARTLPLPPSCCVPFIKLRKISESGVRRLMQSFRDVASAESLFAGASAAGNLPMVVPLAGTLIDYPKKYFMDDLGYSDADADAEVSKFSCWYGIVEGCHRNEALRRLTRLHPDSFAAFTWTVLLLKPAPVHALRAFARNIIEKQKALLYNCVHTIRFFVFFA